MGPWPFDRLLAALAPVCARHDVFVQTGTSTTALDCPSAPYLSWSETQRRLGAADVVITHAGNTVRLVQRLGKIPIAVAREAARGEMRNDHQVDYLRRDRVRGRVVVVDGELHELAATVDRHPEVEAAMLDRAAALPVPDAAALGRLLTTQLATRASANSPVAAGPCRWAFDQLNDRSGSHLDIAAGDGTLPAALRRHTALRVVGVHVDDLADAPRDRDGGPAEPGCVMRSAIPLRDRSFESVSMVNVLNGVAVGAAVLGEVHRVLAPGGIAVLTVSTRRRPERVDAGRVGLRAARVRAIRAKDHAGALLDLLDRTGFTTEVRDGTAFPRASIFLRAVRRG